MKKEVDEKDEVRITFYVDRELHKAFKREAVDAGSMQAVMMKLVKDWLGQRGALPATIAPRKRVSSS